MGVCLTSACISLAISWLTRSIWRSLQGSPLLPSPSLAQPSVAQLDSVATVCPHPQSQSAPGSDPIRAPAIMSSLIWTCHTSPDTYPRHAVTFCPAGAKKTLPRFSPSPSLSHFACCFTLPFLFDPLRSLTLFPPLLTVTQLASIILSPFLLRANPPAFPVCPFLTAAYGRYTCLCAHLCFKLKRQPRKIETGIWWQLHSVTQKSFS